MSSLEEAFQEVSGVGEVKAEQLADIARTEMNDGVPGELEAHIREGWDYYSSGRESYAGKFFRRAYNYLD